MRYYETCKINCVEKIPLFVSSCYPFTPTRRETIVKCYGGIISGATLFAVHIEVQLFIFIAIVSIQMQVEKSNACAIMFYPNIGTSDAAI
jgi:hypothetical protein